MTGQFLDFFVPGKMPGMNEIISAAKGCGGRGLGYSIQKKKWTNAIVGMIRQVCRTSGVPRYNYVHVKFTWHEAKANRDPDNISAGQKFVFDALKEAGVIANDGQKNVEGFTHKVVISKTPGVWVQVEERFTEEL